MIFFAIDETRSKVRALYATLDPPTFPTMAMLTMLLMTNSEPPHKPVRPSQRANSPCPRIPSACAGKINISWKYHHAEE